MMKVCLLFQIINRYPIAHWTDDRISIGCENQISFAINRSEYVGKLHNNKNNISDGLTELF